MRKTILALGAVSATSLAVAMAIGGGLVRAETTFDKTVLAGTAALVAVAVHTLPAILKRPFRFVVWFVWAACLASALWGHVWFLSFAGHSSAELRAEGSATTKALLEQQQALQQALAQSKARSAATVASLLAKEQRPAQREALEIELTEARRDNQRREQLVVLSEKLREAKSGASADPLAKLGVAEAKVQIAGNLLLAGLLEILGMLLWFELLGKQPGAESVPAPAPAAANSPPPKVRASAGSPKTKPKAAPARSSAELEPNPLLDQARWGISIGRLSASPSSQELQSFLQCSARRAAIVRQQLLRSQQTT